MEEMTFKLKSDPNKENPQFTLSCVSIDGPATTVTWYRDSVDISEEVRMVSELQNSSTAQYKHTVNVHGRKGGLYQCKMSNDKPSMDSSQLYVQGKEQGRSRANLSGPAIKVHGSCSRHAHAHMRIGLLNPSTGCVDQSVQLYVYVASLEVCACAVRTSC